jgi:hypothetical protein
MICEMVWPFSAVPFVSLIDFLLEILSISPNSEVIVLDADLSSLSDLKEKLETLRPIVCS